MKNSPWGRVQEETPIVPGIIRVHTASHGGYHCTSAAQRTIERTVPGFTPFAGRGWYEEDCDWAVVALMHPDVFKEEAVVNAVKTIISMDEGGYMGPVRRWLTSDGIDASALRLMAASYETLHAEDYRVVTYVSPPPGSPPGSWRVVLRRIRDGESKRVLFPSYPTKGRYTAEELDHLALT